MAVMDTRQGDQTLSERVASEIRAEMGRQQVTGRELARRLGKTQNWVATRIRGEVAIDLNDLESIADALGVSVAEFFPSDRAATVGYSTRAVAVLRTRPTSRAEVLAGFPSDPLSLYENEIGSRLITDHRSRALAGVQ